MASIPTRENYFEQIAYFLTVSGKLKTDLSELIQADLHPMAKKVIQESLQSKNVRFTNKDIWTGFSLLKDCSKDVIRFLVKSSAELFDVHINGVRSIHLTPIDDDFVKDVALNFLKCDINYLKSPFEYTDYIQLAYDSGMWLTHRVEDFVCFLELTGEQIDELITYYEGIYIGIKADKINYPSSKSFMAYDEIITRIQEDGLDCKRLVNVEDLLLPNKKDYIQGILFDGKVYTKNHGVYDYNDPLINK